MRVLAYGIAEGRVGQDDPVRPSCGAGAAVGGGPGLPDRHRPAGQPCRLVERARSRHAGLRPDHRRPARFRPRSASPAGLPPRRHRHAAGDHHGDPERHRGRRADRHPDPAEPARPSRRRRHGRSVRPRRQAADLRRQRGDAQGQDHLRSRGRAVAARHRRSGHASPPHRFRRLDDRRPHGDGDRSQRPLGQGSRPSCGNIFPTASRRISAAPCSRRPVRRRASARPVRVRSAASAAASSASKGARRWPAKQSLSPPSPPGLLARKGAARPAMRRRASARWAAATSRISAGTTWASSRPSRPKRRATRDHDAFGEDVVEHPRAHPTGLTPVDSPVHHQQAEIADRLGADDEVGRGSRRDRRDLSSPSAAEVEPPVAARRRQRGRRAPAPRRAARRALAPRPEARPRRRSRCASIPSAT